MPSNPHFLSVASVCELNFGPITSYQAIVTVDSAD